MFVGTKEICSGNPLLESG